jgi:PAS domain S-box-containing protein
VASDTDEDARLRAVALQNAQSILVARRRAEEALRQQSEWLRTTLASIGDAVITTDVDGRVTFMNAVAQALTGWPQTDALGHMLPEVFHIVHEETREPVDNPAFRALRANSTIRLANHTVLVSRTGQEYAIDDSAAPIRDETGATVGAVLVFSDVSERRRTDLARAHLAAIVESSDDAIVSKTLQSVILSWNKGAERIFRRTRPSGSRLRCSYRVSGSVKRRTSSSESFEVSASSISRRCGCAETDAFSPSR